MQTPRLYVDRPLSERQQLRLNEAESHYLLRVLRLKPGRQLRVFNGEECGEYQAELLAQEKRNALLQLHSYVAVENRSPLNIHLLQAISRGERMDYVVQKAVELGVASITPVFAQRCNVKLDEQRVKNRLQHWQKIMISACEQSGRCRLAEIRSPETLNDFLTSKNNHTGFICDLGCDHTIATYQQETINATAEVLLLVGPEGGFTQDEQAVAKQQGLLPLSLGPRVLRTETAAVTALTLLQSRWGDL